MTCMREKIARAMYDATPFKNTEGEYDQQSPEYQRMCLLRADAALGALTEPTNGMELAGGLKYEGMWFEDDGTFTGVIFTDMGTVFRAMIQAARDGA